MKPFYTCLFFTALNFICHSQDIENKRKSSLVEYTSSSIEFDALMSEDIVSGDNIENYKVEYELIGYTFPLSDSSILELLELQDIYPLRKAYDDVVMHDLQHGVQILLYSFEKALAKRQEVTPTEATSK
jgi:hypothetical protein